jgi:hypothetical protein
MNIDIMLEYSIGLFGLLLAGLLYFLPSLIAYARGHHNWVPILLVNFFTGWFFLGWIVALVWSTTAVKTEATALPVSSTPSPLLKQQLEDLRGFYDSGLITEAEYKQKKADVLASVRGEGYVAK